MLFEKKFGEDDFCEVRLKGIDVLLFDVVVLLLFDVEEEEVFW